MGTLFAAESDLEPKLPESRLVISSFENGRHHTKSSVDHVVRFSWCRIFLVQKFLRNPRVEDHRDKNEVDLGPSGLSIC